MVSLLILFTSAGVLLAAISVPLILGKIRPNPLYGFRVKKTLEDPGVWYPVNAYAAKRLLVAGLAIGVSAGLLFLVPGIDLLVYVLSCAGIGLGALLVAVIQSFLYLRTFPSNANS
jgi:SdpI/YfhL protein family